MFINLVSVFISLFLIVLLLRERRNARKGCRSLAKELITVAETLEKVAYGLLDQNLKLPANDSTPELLAGMTAVSRSFSRLTAEPLHRLCFVGSDAWIEGSKAGRVIGDHLAGRGKVAVAVTTSLDALIMSQRYRSFAAVLAREYPKIQLVEVFEVMSDQERAAAWTKQWASQLDAIYITGNSAAVGVSAGLRSLGAAKPPFVLCYDLDPVIVNAMKDGIIGASLVSSTYAQGRDPVLHLFNHLVAGWKPLQERLLLQTHLVSAAKLHDYWDDITAEPLKDSILNQTGVTLVSNSAKKLRILAITEDWNNAFQQMNSGIKAAAKQLAPLNVEIVLFPLNQMRNPTEQVVAMAEERLEFERKLGLDAVTAFVGTPEIVPVLNNFAATGIPVATFNSEPLGLRSMIHWLVGNIGILKRFSDEYQSGHGEITVAVKEVLASLEGLVANVARSAESAGDGATAVSVLNTAIDEAVTEAERQTESAVGLVRVGEEIKALVDVLNQGIIGLQTMKEQVENSSSKAVAVNEQSQRISAMVGTIGDIADRTTLLAFNASIEASRAGEAGRGFKVIAGEIRGLADKSAASAKDIAALIAEIHKTVAESVTANAQAKIVAEAQVGAVSEANSRLAAIVEHLASNIDLARAAIDRNSAALGRMRKSAGGLSAVVEHSVEISSENDRTISALSSSFTEISAQFTEMDRQTRQLSELVGLLDNTVGAFHVD